MMKVLNKINSVQDRGLAARFAFGFACSLVMVLGMWLISTLSHAQDSNLGLTWQSATSTLLFFGIILSLAMKRKKK